MEDEFMTPLAQSAASTHELFNTYVAAGFTEEQALYVTGCVVSTVASFTLSHPHAMFAGPAAIIPRCAVCGGVTVMCEGRAICPDHPAPPFPRMGGQ